MSKWTTTLLTLVVLIAVSVHASPIGDGATNKVMARQEGTAPTAEVVVSPTSAPAVSAAEEEEDDDPDDDDDYDIGLDDDDDDDDETEDDDDDDDDDYLERFFDDILADDDDDDEEKPAKPVAAAEEVTSAPVEAVTAEISGNTAGVAAEEDEYDDDDDDDDEDEDQDEAASETAEQQKPATGEDETEEDDDEDDEAAEKDEGADDEDDDDDDNDVTDDEDLEDDLDDLDSDEDDDDTDIVSAKSARALGAKAPKMPAAHLTKYNRFVDSIIGRINDVLKKSFDPVTVRLTRGSPPPSRRPVKNDPKHTAKTGGEEGPTYELVAVSRNEDLTIGKSTAEKVEIHTLTPGGHKKRGRRTKNKGNTKFGRGAKKELRSATATTDKMTGRMVLRVGTDGVARLHSIRVLQPKQVRVESDDDHDRTREFVWRRSSHIAGLVSQKLNKAARDLLQSKATTNNEHHDE